MIVFDAVTGTSSATAVANVVLQHAADSQVGYVWMFILMAATPYILLVVIGGGIVRARRKQREREVEEAIQDQQTWETKHSGEVGGAS
ncbi:MAG: hypothetical protein MJB57_11460 [Gemmatimonadetes bacterium]|nr:hypothetical protein [Gemmatimonadota bacterium]